MDIVQAIVLGLIQGLTEFFPVSSSGHLALARTIFGIDIENALLFDIMMHVGTLAAVFIVFWKDILGLFKPPFKRLALLAFASVPAALAGFFLSGYLASRFFSVKLLPFMFLLTAVLLGVTEYITTRPSRTPREGNRGKPVGFKSAAIMGLTQAVAVIPGISRSGSTICAGVLSGAEREKAARFSFFLSIPIILGSAAFSLLKGGGDAFGDVSLTAVAAGMLAAAVSGFFAIKLMLKVISKSNYKWFAVYLSAIAIVAIVYGYVIT